MLNNSLPQYSTLQTAADQTGLSYYLLRQWILEGKVKYIKSGVKYLINIASLKEFLEHQEEGE